MFSIFFFHRSVRTEGFLLTLCATYPDGRATIVVRLHLGSSVSKRTKTKLLSSSSTDVCDLDLYNDTFVVVVSLGPRRIPISRVLL